MILSPILSLPTDADWTTRACDWAVLVAFALSSTGHLKVSLSLAQSRARRRVSGSRLSLAILAKKIRNQTLGSAVGIDVGLNSFAVTSDGRENRESEILSQRGKVSCQSTAQMGRGKKKTPRPTPQEKSVVKSLPKCMSVSVINDITLHTKNQEKWSIVTVS